MQPIVVSSFCIITEHPRLYEMKIILSTNKGCQKLELFTRMYVTRGKQCQYSTV